MKGMAFKSRTKGLFCGALYQAFAGATDQTRQQQLQQKTLEAPMRRFGFILATLTLAMFLTAVYAPKPAVANRAAAAQMGHPVASIGEIFRGY
ncbi:hypothetical protein [Pseudomonas sp. UFMG81]|uniref:hypothetical protein n=1 Tax=Pseudomonas sp. UFMG81 TaxID=2745936 RepID=UPI00189080BD|nr:hypothetical protein [Pseudomonas sp. UFMG81]